MEISKASPLYKIWEKSNKLTRNYVPERTDFCSFFKRVALTILLPVLLLYFYTLLWVFFFMDALLVTLTVAGTLLILACIFGFWAYLDYLRGQKAIKGIYPKPFILTEIYHSVKDRYCATVTFEE